MAFSLEISAFIAAFFRIYLPVKTVLWQQDFINPQISRIRNLCKLHKNNLPLPISPMPLRGRGSL